MAHPIFNIPEILRLIFKKLGSHNLVPLLTVSHRFFICAIPFVWEHVSSSGKLRNLVFPDVDIEKIDGTWIKGIQPLNEESLTRFHLYAPHVKRIRDYIDWKGDYLSWTMLIRAIPARPLFPNLRVFTIHNSEQTTWVAQVIDALLCPTLVEIRAPGRRRWSQNPVLSPQRLAMIAELCPKIQALQLFSKPVPGHSHIVPSGAPPSDSVLASLGQLRSLRFLGAGPEILSTDVLVLLGNLPSLESLVLFIPSSHPEQLIPSQFPQSSAKCFPALQHVGIYYRWPSLISRLWKTLPFVRQITSVWIKVNTDLQSTDDDVVVRDLLSSVCQFSPNVTDFQLDLVSQIAALELELFTSEVIRDLAQLPLRRMRILTSATQLVPPEDYEQLAMALPNVEYLDIQDCHFTFQGLACVAKHLPELRCLGLAVHSADWPSKDELPPIPAPSPSVLCLKSNFTVDTGSLDQNESIDNDLIESISTTLHRLWPNGVRCEFSNAAADWCTEADCDTLELINSSIKQLCFPKEFNAPNMRSAAEWQYIDSRIDDWLAAYMH